MLAIVLEQALLAFPLVLGGYITISLLKLPDFSLESAFLMGAIFAYLGKGYSLPIICLCAILGGILVALVVCLVHRFLPYLLSAVVTNGLFHGFAQYLLKVPSVHFSTGLNRYEEIVFHSSLDVLLLIGGMVFMHSCFGYALAVYGNNPRFFGHYKISSRYLLCLGIGLAYGLAGFGGFLFAQANGFVDLSINTGIVLLCLTSLVLGKIFFKKPNPSILVPLLGVLGYFFMQQLLLRIGFNLKYFNAFQALFILTVLIMSKKEKRIASDHLGV